jgi:multicomponent Na+:H+ antiporter subunit F
MIMKGPTIWDRFLGVNLLLSKTIIIIIIFSSMHKTAYLLDFAIVYVLLAFVSAFFMARFIAGRIRKERKEKQ